MRLNTLLACPDCGGQCTIDIQRKRGTMIRDCPDCGTDESVIGYDESVVIGNAGPN